MKRTGKKLLSLSIVFILLVGLLTACGKDDKKDTSKDSGKASEVSEEKEEKKEKEETSSTERDTLIVATENEPPTVHPAEHSATASSFINLLTHDTLVNLNEDMEFVPNLATEWENISDTEWVFKLREDVYFHNGDHMTAEDVAESLLWVKQFPQTLQYNRSIVDTEVLDEYEVKIITDGPQASLLYDLLSHCNVVYPKDLMEEDYDFNKDPIGTGPYIFKEWISGEKLEFVANEEYFDEDRKASIPNLSWRIIPEGSSRTIALENGEIDYIIEVATNDVEKLRNAEHLDVIEKPATTHNFLMINNELDHFDNIDFRRALNAAIDREAVVQVAMDGYAIPTGSQTPIQMNGSNDTNAIGYDPEKAKEYFEASGINPEDVNFTIICSDDAKTRAGQVIQANLHEILDINVEIERMDLATYLDTTAEGNYEAAIGNYTSTDLYTYLKGVYHSDSIGGSNKTRTVDEKLDKMIEDAGLYLNDFEGQVALMEDISDYLNTEIVPQIPLYQTTIVRAYNADLGGINLNMAMNTYYNLLYWK